MQNKLFRNSIILAIVGLIFGMNAASSTISSDGTTLNVDGDRLGNYSKINDAIDNASLIEFEPSAGLAPNVAVSNHDITIVSSPFRQIMWGYIASSSVFDEGTCYFDVEDPGDIEYLHDTESDDFLSGGTGYCGEWIACEYSTGALWEIDIDTGDMTYIGGGGVGLNGLAWNLGDGLLYGASGSKLYLIDPDDGMQELIGPFGNGVNMMIGIAADECGQLYGWDLGDKLWTIDTETGEATEVGPLGININYIQDGGFDWDSNILYLTAFIINPYYGSYLCVCDVETGQCTVVDKLEGNSEITASVISLGSWCCEHDLGIKRIICPNDGHANEEMDVVVQVKNFGNNSEEDVPVTVIICKNDVEEYNETVYIDVPWNEIVDVEMPSWTPDDWQRVSNEYINYTVAASVHLYGDDNPNNDDKEKWIELYFGYFHDVGCIGISGPESGPAQTFPLNGTIKNFGQYDECCFKTYVEIAELDFDNADPLLFEDFSPYYYFPPTGWTRTTKKWNGSSNNYCQQGDGGEARFYYYPSETGKFRLYTGPIDTTSYSAVSVEFVHYLNHYSGPYNLMIETSRDGNTWTPIWVLENPGDIPKPEWIQVTAGDNVGGENFHVSITFDGYSWNTNWWHVDSFSLWGVHAKEPEYTDELCIQEIVPGEEMILEFDDWIPEFLQYEISGDKIYAAKVWTQMDDPEDNHRANDAFQKCVLLNYFHDVAIESVSSPVRGRQRHFYAVKAGYPGTCVWFDPEDLDSIHDIGTFPSNSFPQSATFVKDVEWVCDTIGNIYRDTNGNPDDPDWKFVGNSGTGDLTGLAYHAKSGKLYGCSPSTFYEIDMTTGKATMIGSFGIPSPMISIECDNDGVMYGFDLGFGTSYFYTIDLDTGKASIYCSSFGYSINDMSFEKNEDVMWIIINNWDQGELWTMDMKDCTWTFIGYFPKGVVLNCFSIPYQYPLSVYISPGIESIKAIAKNIGTFPEQDMTCNAKIYEYITNSTNGTLVYEDKITDINISTPLGGKETLTFDDYNFAVEGGYLLLLNITNENDDVPKNNIFRWGIGCDDTPPISSYVLDPPEADGENGWYVSNVEVTIYAKDPSIACYFSGSGVREINYTINGVGGTIPGESGTFQVTEDGNDILVEYWAVDMVGNVESKNSFTIDIDQTKPVIDSDGVHWKAFRENPLSNIWYVRFWTNATDATSGMDRVEMYINEGLIEINANPDGNLYEFVIMWSTVLETVTFSWRHYDRAGWYTYAEIQGDEPSSKSYSSETRKSSQNQITHLKNLSIKSD